MMTMSTSSLPGAGLCLAIIAALASPGSAQAQAPTPWIVPEGFEVSVFAENVENARSMALGPEGTVFVGSRTGDKVHALVDGDGDHRAERTVVIASDLNQPNGIAIRDGALYVATANQILRYDDIEQHLDSPPTPVVVRDGLPNPDRGHTWKFISFGPDGLLYMSVGAPCNTCLSDPLVSAILRMQPDGSDLEVFAEGVRNSVGFAWHPVTEEMWFTDNGRDMMGDDIPDLRVMREVAFPCSPSDAAEEVKAICAFVSRYPGGRGCVRDLLEQRGELSR